MRRRCPRFLLLSLPLLLCGGTIPPEPATWTFGVSLSTGPHSQPFSLYLVQEHNYDMIATEPITRQQFVLQAQGMVTSKANPDGVNLFLRNKVRGCLHPDDSTKFLSDCPAFDQLWKLRFKDYPFLVKSGHPPEAGWADRRDTPSPRQMLLLSDYGITRLQDIARGMDAFRLLRDVGDSTWVDNYRSGS